MLFVDSSLHCHWCIVFLWTKMTMGYYTITLLHLSLYCTLVILLIFKINMTSVQLPHAKCYHTGLFLEESIFTISVPQCAWKHWPKFELHLIFVLISSIIRMRVYSKVVMAPNFFTLYYVPCVCGFDTKILILLILLSISSNATQTKNNKVEKM